MSLSNPVRIFSGLLQLPRLITYNTAAGIHMFIQVMFLYFTMIVAGVLLCLFAVMDPREVPETSRQMCFPLGLALVLLPIGSALGAGMAVSAGRVFDFYLGVDVIAGLTGLAGFVHGAICGAVVGLGLGLMRNRRLRLKMERETTSKPEWILLVAHHYERYFGPH